MGSSTRDGRDRELYHAVYNSLQHVQDSFHRLQTAIRPMPPRYSPFPEQRRIGQTFDDQALEHQELYCCVTEYHVNLDRSSPMQVERTYA